MTIWNGSRIKNTAAALLLTGILLFSYFKMKQAREFDPFNLKLTSASGTFTLNALTDKKIILLYFGFLGCPDVCPTTLSQISAVFKELSENDLKKISFLFIDLDPERDTMEKLKQYTAYFHPQILPILLKSEDLNLLTRFFGISFVKVPLKSAMSYTIDHSSEIIVISPNQKIEAPILYGTPSKIFVNRLRKIINE